MMGTNLQQDLLLVERSCQVLGTGASINLAVPPDQLLEACAAIEDCLAWLKEVDQRLTLSDPASELCQLNDSAGHWQPVSDLLLAVVQEAMRQSQASAGLFDPTLGSSVKKPGTDRAFSLPANRWSDVQLDVKRSGIYLPIGIRLDLGSLAKGWAADVVGNQRLRPFANVLVNVGGTLLLRGRQTRYALWAAGLRTPKPQSLAGSPPERAAITLRRGGLATETATRGKSNHQGFQHLPGLRSLYPSVPWNALEAAAPDENESTPLITTATALARTAAHAEVAALVALQRGYPEAVRVVESAWRDDKASRHHLSVDRSVALLLVLESGEVVCSEHLEAYLERYAGGNRQ